jgi:transposase-like protein
MDHKEKQEEERELWKKRIKDLGDSGLSVRQYAKANALSSHQIYYWKNKYSEEPRNQAAHIAEEPRSSVIKVIPKLPVKPSKLPDPKWVAELIKAIHEVF